MRKIEKCRRRYHRHIVIHCRILYKSRINEILYAGGVLKVRNIANKNFATSEPNHRTSVIYHPAAA